MFVAVKLPNTTTWVAARYDDNPWSIPKTIASPVRRLLGRDCDRGEADAVIRSVRIVNDLAELAS